jgi:hypothetical protein
MDFANSLADAPAGLLFPAAGRTKKGTRPWLPQDEALLGTMADRDVADRLGRSVTAVCVRRQQLKIPSHQETQRKQVLCWNQHKDRLLGTMPDAELAKRLGIATFRVFLRRQRLNIPSYRDRA